MTTLHHAPLSRVDPSTLYRIMALRVAVFVHEQKIVDEAELDGAELLPTTELFWIQPKTERCWSLSECSSTIRSTSAASRLLLRGVGADMPDSSSRPPSMHTPEWSRCPRKPTSKSGTADSDSFGWARNTWKRESRT